MRANRIITEALRHADSCHTTPSFMLHGTPTHNKWKHHNLSCLMDALQAPRCTHCLCSMRDPCKMLIREVSSSFRRARCFVVHVSWREYGSVGGALWRCRSLSAVGFSAHADEPVVLFSPTTTEVLQTPLFTCTMETYISKHLFRQSVAHG